MVSLRMWIAVSNAMPLIEDTCYENTVEMYTTRISIVLAKSDIRLHDADQRIKARKELQPYPIRGTSLPLMDFDIRSSPLSHLSPSQYLESFHSADDMLATFRASIRIPASLWSLRQAMCILKVNRPAGALL